MTVSNEAIRAGEMAALGRYLNKETVRLILEAAAPFIAAQALEDAADQFAEGEWADAFSAGNVEDDETAARATAAWVHARAAALRGQG